MCPTQITLRWQARASHKIKINRSSATKDVVEPKVDITFQFVNASG